MADPGPRTPDAPHPPGTPDLDDLDVREPAVPSDEPAEELISDETGEPEPPD